MSNKKLELIAVLHKLRMVAATARKRVKFLRHYFKV
jgi:hypothetical protein